MKKFLFAIPLFIALGVHAQGVTSDLRSASDAAAVTDLRNVGSPTINSYAAPQLAETTSVVRQHGLPVASAGPTYVNGPANDTCVEAGDGLAIQIKVLGINGNKGGAMQVGCDVRARSVNAKVTGQSQTVVSMIQCQDPLTAAAFEDSADLEDLVAEQKRASEIANATAEQKDVVARKPLVRAFRCPDRLRPQWAKDRDAAAGVQTTQVSPAADPFISMSGRQFPSRR